MFEKGFPFRMRTVGGRIREKRKIAGLSQGELAKLTGCKEQPLSHIEVGRSVPTEDTLWLIGSCLCLTRAEIIRLIALGKEHRKNRRPLDEAYAFELMKKMLGRKAIC
ncbi:MAG: helix-turn-helix transcriptional regulator [Desulfobacterales bacterium]|nr:helix-turn-helix transcriptional regulator [Desulfobacterales bacterium]